MKKIILFSSLVCAWVSANAQTLQSVTDNGASTSNTLNSFNPNGFQVTGTVGNPAYMVIDQAANSGGKRWRFGHTGGAPGFGSFDVCNVTDGITPLSIASNGNIGIGTTNPNVPFHVARYGSNVISGMTLLASFTDPTGIKGVSLGYNQYSQAGIIYSENNTGVGSPIEFWTYNGSSFSPRMVFTQAGNLGIGASNPGAKLSFGNVDETIEPDGITWHNPTQTLFGIHRTAGTWAAPNYQQLRLSWETGIILDPGHLFGKSFVDIQGAGIRVSSGSVGIGTLDTKGYKLAVAGNMIAESVKVSLQGTWPDYVFAKDYHLPTLQETEKHIKDKGHLPGIPSAAEVKASGIDLGEMNAKLLQKIEELTLHLIEKDKEIKSMKSDYQELRRMIVGNKSKKD